MESLRSASATRTRNVLKHNYSSELRLLKSFLYIPLADIPIPVFHAQPQLLWRIYENGMPYENGFCKMRPLRSKFSYGSGSISVSRILRFRPLYRKWYIKIGNFCDGVCDDMELFMLNILLHICSKENSIKVTKVITPSPFPFQPILGDAALNLMALAQITNNY